MSSNLLGLLLLCIITSARPPEYHHVDEEVVSTAARQDSFAVTSMGQPVAPPSSISASLAVASGASGRSNLQVASVPQGGGGGGAGVGSAAAVGMPPPPPAQATGSPASAGVAGTAQQGAGPGGRLVRPNGASIAQEAALEAKAASDAQLMAGQQAAHQVKAQLAERAQQAAQAAQAALVGKQQMMEQLEEEVREAQAVVQEEGASLQMAQQEVQAASASAQQAQQQLKVLTSAVQLEQANVGNAEQAATGAQQELAEKMQLVEAARRRVQMLLSQLSAARSDFTNTRQAADKALQAAQEAKINAARSRRAGPLSRREALDVNISAPKSQKHSTSMVPPPGLEEQDGAVSRQRRAPTAEDTQTEAPAPSAQTADDATSVQGSSNEPSTCDGDGSKTAAAASEGITNSATDVGFTEDATSHDVDDVTRSLTDEASRGDGVSDDVTRSLADDSETTVQRDRRLVKRWGRSFFSKLLPSRLIHHGGSVSPETQNLKKGNAGQGTIFTEGIQNGVNENSKQSRADGTSSLETSNQKPHPADDVDWGQSAESEHKRTGKRRRAAPPTLDASEHLPEEDSAFQGPKMSNAPLGMEGAAALGDARELSKSNPSKDQEIDYFNKQVPTQDNVLPRNFESGVAKVDILKSTKYEPIASVGGPETGEFESDAVSARGRQRRGTEKKLEIIEQISEASKDSRVADADKRRKRRDSKTELQGNEMSLQGRNDYISTDNPLIRRQRESYSTAFEKVSDMDGRSRDTVELTETNLNKNDGIEKATDGEVRRRRDNLESYTTIKTDAAKEKIIKKREDVTESQTEISRDGSGTPKLTSVRIVGGNSGLKHSKVNERHQREIPILQTGNSLSLEASTKETLEEERVRREISTDSPTERYVSDDHETKESKTQETNQHVIPELQSEPPGGENYVTKQEDQKERRERQISETRIKETVVGATEGTVNDERHPREATKLNIKSVQGEESAPEERELRDVSALETEITNEAIKVTKPTYISVRYDRDVTQSKVDYVDEREEVGRRSTLRDRRRREISSMLTEPTALVSDFTDENQIDEKLPREIDISIPISIISDVEEATTEDEREKRGLQENVNIRTGPKARSEEGQRHLREIPQHFTSLEDEPKRVKKELEVKREHGIIEGGLKPLDERYPHSAGSHEVVPDKEQRRVKKELEIQKLERANEKGSENFIDERYQGDFTQSRVMDTGKEAIQKPDRSRRELTDSQTHSKKQTKGEDKREVTDKNDGITGNKLVDKFKRETTEEQENSRAVSTIYFDGVRTEHGRPARAIVDSHSDIVEDVTTDNIIRKRNRRQVTEVQTEQTVFISGFKRHTKAQERHGRKSEEEFPFENRISNYPERKQREVDKEQEDDTEKERKQIGREERQVFDARIGEVEEGKKTIVNDQTDEIHLRKIAKSEAETNNFNFPSKQRIEARNERQIVGLRKQNTPNDIDSRRVSADPEDAGYNTDADLKERLKRGFSETHKEYFDNVPFLKERREETLEQAVGGLDSMALLGVESFNREGGRSKFDAIKRQSNDKEKLSTIFTESEVKSETATVAQDRTVTYANGGSMWVSGLPQELIALDDLKVDPEPSNSHRRVKRNRRDTAFANHNQYSCNVGSETRLQRDSHKQTPFHIKRDTREVFQHPFNIRENNNPGVISDQQNIDFLNYLPLLNSTPQSNVSDRETMRNAIDPNERVEEAKKGRNGGKCVGVALADIIESDPWGAPGGRVLRVETR